jgi:hypothetical protein
MADDLIKNLLYHNVKDGNLDWQSVSIDSFGQGLQRPSYNSTNSSSNKL